MNLHNLPDNDSGEGSSSLIFITQTGPEKAEETRTKIKKHVMKDIGKSRRKERYRTKPPAWELAICSPIIIETQCSEAEHQCPKWENGVDENIVTQRIMPAVSSLPESSQTAAQLSQVIAAAAPWGPSQAHGDPIKHLHPQQPFRIAQNPPQIERVWTGRLDPFFQYPIEMDYRSLKLIDSLFDDRYGNVPPFRDTWLPVGLLDPAGFQQLLCNASINLETLRTGVSPFENLEAVRYHTLAIQSINRRIGNIATATTDGFLATIIGLSCYHHAIGDFEGWVMHRNAAVEIIRLRGGMSTVVTNKFISILFFWTENTGTTTLDIPPKYPIPYATLPPLLSLSNLAILTPQFLHLSSIFPYLFQFPQAVEILTIFRDSRDFIEFLSRETVRTAGGIYSDGLFAASYLLPLLHRFLSFAEAEVSEYQAKSVVQAVRLSCCLFFTEIKRLFGVFGIHTGFQTAKLKALLEASGDEWGELGALKLWCLTMGGLESEGEERKWFLDRLAEGKSKLSMGNWKVVESELKGLLWHDDVHDTAFREFVDGHGKWKSGRANGSRFGGHRPWTDIDWMGSLNWL